MKLKCLCVLFYDIVRVKRGTFDTKVKLITVRPTLFEKVVVIVPEGVEGYGMSRGKLLFLVDVKHLTAVNWKEFTVTDAVFQDFASKLGLMSRDKTWKFLGTKGMDMVETLITMGAGYGFFRLAEVLIVNVFK